MAANRKFTRDEIAKAFDVFFLEWFPNVATELDRDAIISHIINGTEPPPNSALTVKMKEKVGAQKLFLEDSSMLKAIQPLTPCQEACGVVAVDVVLFVFGLVGLHVSNQERLARAIIREMGPDTLRGLARAIQNFSEADGAYNKAKALFTLFGQIYSAGGFRAAFKVVKDEMTTWEWIKTGLIAVAQITAWFATDGVAFIAEVALTIMSAEQLIEDSVKAVNACS